MPGDFKTPDILGAMAITIVRLGSPRKPNEGLRLGTVRRPPRGVPKSDFARRDYYDVWLPNLSPSRELVNEALSAHDQKSWNRFARKFRGEMNQPDAGRLLDVLAALSHTANFSLGCYCENEDRCHRSILKDLLAARGAKFRSVRPGPIRSIQSSGVHSGPRFLGFKPSPSKSGT
jgi:uncharacterized protein YeaO (DUF488 family)